jgi:hypothetical protein
VVFAINRYEQLELPGLRPNGNVDLPVDTACSPLHAYILFDARLRRESSLDLRREVLEALPLLFNSRSHVESVCPTTCRSANAKVAFERTTAARSRGRSPRRRQEA